MRFSKPFGSALSIVVAAAFATNSDAKHLQAHFGPANKSLPSIAIAVSTSTTSAVSLNLTTFAPVVIPPVTPTDQGQG